MPIHTIEDAESQVQSALESVRNLPLSAEITDALKYILRDGYRPVIQLEENGRAKRSTAAATNWTPETGEIHIHFEKRSADLDRTQVKSAPVAVSSIVAAPPQPSRIVEPVSATEIAQCCQALDSAEKLGRHFIALKWFRDDFLTAQDFSWTTSDQRRQQVLAHAIDGGRIQSKKIPNPRSPQFPTTTITLNRSISTPAIAPRFQPIPVRGESVSSSLLRDRGSL